MNVMVELHGGMVRLFTSRMWMVGNKPIVLFEINNEGKEIKLGKVRRVFTSECKR